MNQVGEVCLVQLTRRMALAVKKKEQELAHTCPQNSIGKVYHHDPTPLFNKVFK